MVQIGRDLRRQECRPFVERLDALELAEKLKLDLAPVMIYGDDVTHIVTEEGIANLLLCRDRTSASRRSAAWPATRRSAAAATGKMVRAAARTRRRSAGPEDLGIDPLDADRSLLAARSIKDLMLASGGLYRPPRRFRNW